MTFRDRYYLALLNIRKSKFKSILFVLTTLIFFLILSIFFTAKKSVEDFFNDYLNSDFSNRIIAVEVGENDRNDIVNQIEKLNNKHISKVFHSNYELFLQAKIESEDNKINGYASLYGNYDGINYTINYGHDIENDNEIICSSSFYPGNYDNETSDSLFELSKYLNSNFKISYNKDKIDIDSISGDWNIDTIEEYSKNLKLVGTFDIKEDLTQYNMCYVSSEMLENILNSNKVFENKEDEKIFFDGLPALVLVDKYENVQNIINELNNMSYNAYLAYELDTESIQSVFNIINVLTIIIVLKE